VGLTNSSVGVKAIASALEIQKQTPEDRVIALAGNPNVGKSTVFNALTGMNQHTGNWPGKTVTNAQGYCAGKHSYVLVDIPGTYSLMAHSAEEEVARNFICFGEPDAVVVVCDATCLERNLNLVLQTIEITSQVIVCVNLMDEAKRKNIKINLSLLSKQLGVPVIGTIAQKRSTLDELLTTLDQVTDGTLVCSPRSISYPTPIEDAIAMLAPQLEELCQGRLNTRWLALKLLDQDPSLMEELESYLGKDFLQNEEVSRGMTCAKQKLEEQEIHQNRLKDIVVSTLVSTAEDICCSAVTYEKEGYHAADRKIDHILTSKATGYPIMVALLGVVFWLTITGANYPSQLLSTGLFWIEDRLTDLFLLIHAPDWLYGILVLGVYRVLAWVVSVMLPPMAIFFPLFTLLEDVGYLPRIAYNLDKPFKRCCACGKQALTMCIVITILYFVSTSSFNSFGGVSFPSHTQTTPT